MSAQPSADMHLALIVDEGRLPAVVARPLGDELVVRLETVNAGWAAAVSIIGPPAAVQALGEQIAAAAGGGEASSS
jgi:hypothetical protein